MNSADEKHGHSYSDQLRKEHQQNRAQYGNLKIDTNKAHEKNADSIIKLQENKLFRLEQQNKRTNMLIQQFNDYQKYPLY